MNHITHITSKSINSIKKHIPISMRKHHGGGQSSSEVKLRKPCKPRVNTITKNRTSIEGSCFWNADAICCVQELYLLVDVRGHTRPAVVIR